MSGAEQLLVIMGAGGVKGQAKNALGNSGSLAVQDLLLKAKEELLLGLDEAI